MKAVEVNQEHEISQLEADVSAEMADYNFCPAQVLAARAELKEIEKKERQEWKKIINTPVRFAQRYNSGLEIHIFYKLQKIRVVKAAQVQEEHLFILDFAKELDDLIKQTKELNKEVERLIESEEAIKYAVYFELLDLKEQYPDHGLSETRKMDISSTIAEDYQRKIQYSIETIEYLKKKKALLEQAQVQEEHHKMLTMSKAVAKAESKVFKFYAEFNSSEGVCYFIDRFSDGYYGLLEKKELLKEVARKNKNGIAYFKAELDYQEFYYRQLNVLKAGLVEEMYKEMKNQSCNKKEVDSTARGEEV